MGRVNEVGWEALSGMEKETGKSDEIGNFTAMS